MATSNPPTPRVLVVDERRTLVIGKRREDAIAFATSHFIRTTQYAIAHQGYCAVALSGGSTPKAVFQQLSQPENAKQVNWKKVLLFWSDERSVPPDHPDSNYRMAMESGFKTLAVPHENIFRMPAETAIQENAKAYEQLIKTKIPSKIFDLVMLGMGEDGHTASLFPHTQGLKDTNELVIANYVEQKKTWRMTLTFNCINSAQEIVIYTLGADKAEMLAKVLKSSYQPDLLPSQQVGTIDHQALWVVDEAAAGKIMSDE